MMHQQPQTQTAPGLATTCTSFACPLQVLVIDEPNGPADVLMNTISRLLDRDISVMTLSDHTDALRVLSYDDWDLVMLGLDVERPLQLALLPHIFGQNPARPILAVGRDLSAAHRRDARTYGAQDVLDVPGRAADLKQVMRWMAAHYL